MAMKDDIKYTNSGGGKRIARFAFKAGGTARGNVTLTTVNWNVFSKALMEHQAEFYLIFLNRQNRLQMETLIYI